MPFECNNIIVGYDGFDRDEGIPSIAFELAEEHEARLRVVHVASPPPQRRWWHRGAEAPEIHGQLLEKRRTHLKEILAPARDRGIEVSSTVRDGVPDVVLPRPETGQSIAPVCALRPEADQSIAPVCACLKQTFGHCGQNHLSLW